MTEQKQNGQGSLFPKPTCEGLAKLLSICSENLPSDRDTDRYEKSKYFVKYADSIRGDIERMRELLLDYREGRDTPIRIGGGRKKLSEFTAEEIQKSFDSTIIHGQRFVDSYEREYLND